MFLFLQEEDFDYVNILTQNDFTNNVINSNKRFSFYKGKDIYESITNSKINLLQQEDLVEGLYDGYKLDGGLLKNTLIEPLLNNNLDKIIIISMRHDYKLSDTIKEKVSKEDINIVRPNTIFEKNDTLRFEREFCRKIYSEGYQIGKNLSI